MSLRFKLAWILSLVIALQAALGFAIQRWVVMPSFVALERAEAERDAARAVRAIRRELHHLETFCSDWASWDDTYAYVHDRSKEYEEANFVVLSFVDNNLHLIFVLDTAGEVVWGRIYDLETEQSFQMPDFPQQRWATTHPLLQHRDVESSISGVLLSSRGPMLVASEPILTSEDGGPIRGSFVMGRFLDEDLTETLEEQTQLALNILPLRRGWVSDEHTKILARLSTESPYYLHEYSEDLLHVYTVFPGIDGEPALLMCIDVSRDTRVQGRAATHFARISTIAGGLAVLLVVLVLLRRTVVTPVRQLTGWVTRIGASAELSLLPVVQRRDEIGVLAREFSAMIRRLKRENTERKRAEDALCESEARIRAILETAPDAIITVGDDGTIEAANPAAARLFGYTQEELEGTKAMDLMPDLVDAGQQEGLQDRGPLVGLDFAGTGREGFGKRKDGAKFPVHVTASEVHFADRRLLTFIVRDVTDLKDMQDRAARAEQLAALGEMGAAIAHEIRNPLAAISGAAQILRDGFGSDDPRREIMEQIIGHVGRVDGIVQRLLAFAKPWTVEKEVRDLREMVERVSSEAQALERWQHIEFAFEGNPSLMVPVDPSLFEQVLWNLLENAADAMRGAGKVRWAFAETATSGQITMTDQGPGVPPDVQENVFRPFFTTKTYGTGLGLPICKYIVEAHGGTVTFSTEAEGGTTVTIQFPRGD